MLTVQATTGYAALATPEATPPTTPKKLSTVSVAGNTGLVNSPKLLKPMSLVVVFFIFNGRPICFLLKRSPMRVLAATR